MDTDAQRRAEIKRRIEKGLDIVAAGDVPSEDLDITDSVETLLDQADAAAQAMKAHCLNVHGTECKHAAFATPRQG